jgi:murein L,D-transpeptidase YafK
LLRSLLASAALAAAVAVAGCDTDGSPTVGGRHLQPLSDRLVAEIEKRNMETDSPILLRIFKEESELEVWKENRDGRFALLRSYPICRWSGELGPKVKEGDRQAPEGFYTIHPGLMNPNSQYYLAINMGFPNAYDRAHGRSGAFLMIHGDCSSRGCYAMTDEQVSEIYALARESFLGGQKSFQIQAFPFRMTALNMAKHRNSPHMPFWKMLKQGYDHFEVTRLEPKVDVCEKRYVFDAETSGRFSPADRCPSYRVPSDIAAAVRDKQHRDEMQIADLISRGTPVAPVKMGTDGGMNQTFLAAVRSYGGPGTPIRTSSGTIPAHVNPPGEAAVGTTGSTMSLASSESKPVAPSKSNVQVASAAPGGGGGIGGFFSNLFGSKSEDPQAAPASTSAPAAKSKSAKPATKAVASTTARPKSEPQRAASVTTKPPDPPSKPPASPPRQEAEPQSKPAVAASSTLSGAAPTVPAGGFDNRFGAWR